MPLGRLVPWSSWDEWQRVRAGIFSSETTQFKEALDQVSSWEARGKLPLGADMTATIQRMRLRDPAHIPPHNTSCQDVSTEQELMLRMQYAIAIIRLVNGISDSAQKGNVAKSVAHLAETAGLPRILVDIRHEASHNELPSLALLRLGAHSALNWLSQSYWQQQADHVTLRKAQIHELLQAYVTSQEESLRRSQRPSTANDERPDDRNGLPEQAEGGNSIAQGQKLRREILSQLLNKVQSNAASLVEPLLDTGLLDVDSACSGKVEISLSEAGAAAAVWQGSMKDLSALWPSLRQLLLAGAVQRLAGHTSESLKAGSSEVAAQAWARLLLEGPPARKESGADTPSHKSKKRKKAAAEPDQHAAPETLWVPSKRLLLSCLSTCLQASAVTSQGALKRTIRMVLGKLRSSEQSSPASALQFKALSDLANAFISEGSALNGSMTDAATASAPDLSKAAIALKEATAVQQMLLQQHRPTEESINQRRSGWQSAEDWAPCAIGMLPCALSPSGMIRSLALPGLAACDPQPCPDSGLQPEHGGLAESAVQATSASKLELVGAQNDAQEHALIGQQLAASEEIQDEECYFARFEKGQGPHNGRRADGRLTQAEEEDSGLQEQHAMQHQLQPLALTKPVKVL